MMQFDRMTLGKQARELAFWKAFRQRRYQPELLFQDEAILSRIGQHPMALWKCSDRQKSIPMQER